jgi:hypothetical protein
LIVASVLITRAQLDPTMLVEQVLLASLLGPAASYIATLTPTQGLLYATVTLVVREILIYILWRYTIRAACIA